MRILIAEDEAAVRKVLVQFLTPFGAIDAVEDGKQAVDAFRLALSRKNTYGLVCMDIHMPNMDGHQAIVEIRDLENQFKIPRETRSKIMMITAIGDSVHVMGAFDEECDAYLVKPFDRAQLYEQLYLMGLINKPADARSS